MDMDAVCRVVVQQQDAREVERAKKQAGWGWFKTDGEWRLRSPLGSYAATAYETGTWHVWDPDGNGGENASEASRELAQWAAERAAKVWWYEEGWVKPSIWQHPDEAPDTLGDFAVMQAALAVLGENFAHERAGALSVFGSCDGAPLCRACLANDALEGRGDIEALQAAVGADWRQPDQ